MSTEKRRVFSEDFKLEVVSQVFSSEKSKYLICKENDISFSVLQEWIRKFASSTKTDELSMSSQCGVKSEMETLRKKLAEVQKELKSERMRADFYQTMVEVAEEELKIPIRKKAGAKR
jgi:transposase-like protein